MNSFPLEWLEKLLNVASRFSSNTWLLCSYVRVSFLLRNESIFLLLLRELLDLISRSASFMKIA